MSIQGISEYPMPDSFPGSSPNARFLAGSLPVSDTSWKSYLLKSSWSVLLHVLGLGLLLWALTRSGAMEQLAKAVNVPDITWLAEPGPGGGGGGGGNKMPDPPRKAELPGKDKLTVPVEKPPAVEPLKKPKDEPNPDEQLTLPAKMLASAETTSQGIIDTGPQSPSPSQGSGTGGGGGTGSG